MTLPRTKKDSFSQFKRKENPPRCTFLPWRLLQRAGLAALGSDTSGGLFVPPPASFLRHLFVQRHSVLDTGNHRPEPPAPLSPACVCVCVCVCDEDSGSQRKAPPTAGVFWGPPAPALPWSVRKGLALQDARILITPALGLGEGPHV